MKQAGATLRLTPKMIEAGVLAYQAWEEDRLFPEDDRASLYQIQALVRSVVQAVDTSNIRALKTNIPKISAPEARGLYEARPFPERVVAAYRLVRLALRVLCYNTGMWRRLLALKIGT